MFFPKPHRRRRIQLSDVNCPGNGDVSPRSRLHLKLEEALGGELVPDREAAPTGISEPVPLTIQDPQHM